MYFAYGLLISKAYIHIEGLLTSFEQEKEREKMLLVLNTQFELPLISTVKCFTHSLIRTRLFLATLGCINFLASASPNFGDQLLEDYRWLINCMISSCTYTWTSNLVSNTHVRNWSSCENYARIICSLNITNQLHE